MGLFAKRKSKSSKGPTGSTTVEPIDKNENNNVAPPEQRPGSVKRTSTPPSSTKKRKPKKSSSIPVEEPLEITMDMVPQLVADLEQCSDTSGDKPARALRMLFSLSEHANDSENRVVMTRKDNGRLVPVLLNFLKRCERGSSEQYLALLVLNNISIPSENKRWIAMDCGGANVFSRLLCEDPSCHLMAIILVNLTFCDAELRRELVLKDFCVIESLSYALRISSLTSQEYEAREHVQITGNSPRDLLAALLQEDKRLRPALSDLDYNSGNNFRSRDLLVDPAKQLYPETARWCLSALKNLTRPSKDATAARALITCGIVDLLIRFVTVGGNLVRDVNTITEEGASENDASPTSSTDSTPVLDPEQFTNAPTTWDSNSMQDAALFCVLNLCATPSAREYMREVDTVNILSLITAYHLNEHYEHEHAVDQYYKVLDLQCLKARMAMSYLLGSSGHFGQYRSRNSTTDLYNANPSESVLNMPETEMELLVELLANTLHQRAKEGPGGYSAATFNVKGVIFAIRCLLTHPLNQVGFANTVGSKLNVLLLKALAQHAIQGKGTMDAETAEHACFSLYLQSNHGFQAQFLPAIFGEHDKLSGKGSLTAKVLTSYLHKESITPAGRHGADQLLLRLRYLMFKGSVSQLSSSHGSALFVSSDFAFDDKLMEATERIIVEKRSHGARPKREIFDRPILRSRAPQRGNQRASWENRASVTVFPSALEAVKQLSYGSTKVRHVDAIDDILIANNIVNSANGEKTESYNYWWSWKDGAHSIRSLERQTSGDSIFTRNASQATESSEPMSIFNAFRCGGPMLCGTDTTMK